jgi:outer membrane receptor for ferrienterochelin and colicin
MTNNKILIKMRAFFIALLVILFSNVNGQSLKGKIVEKTAEGKVYVLPGASAFWKGTNIGVSADADGLFELERSNESILVVSFVGYTSQEIKIGNTQTYIEIELKSGEALQEVNIVKRKRTAYMSSTKPILTQVVTGEELCKAACCNLGESFETNASVDVAYADAVTGAKQIQMLGLTGQYVQMMTENMANFRGIASKFGLSYVPGAWMDAISISKGAGSVIGGYESIAGQISVDYKKPETSEKFFINGYGNQAGKMELNSNFSVKLNDHWATMFLLHGSQMKNEIDDNKDGFLDIPLSKQGNFINRWRYKSDEINVQFGVKILDENRLGGQMNFDKDIARPQTNEEAIANNTPYGINIDTRRYEAFVKAGVLMPEYENTSMALLLNLTDHEQDSYYGIRDYYGRQKSAYVNYIFQSVFADNENQKYSAGATFIHDNLDERLENTSFTRNENVIGGFFQYTGIFSDMWTLMLGIRYDYHNIYGGFATPRVHLKWNVDENTSIRTSFGVGYRSSNVIAENNTYLASGRDVVILDNARRKVSLRNNADNFAHAMEGFDMEKAFNYGLNIHRTFEIADRDLIISAEYYRTDFKKQVIVDLDSSPGDILFYNLDGKSYSDSYQLELKYPIIERLETTLAYRYNKVRQADKNGDLVEPALKNRYKGLVNFSYSTNMKIWQFDYTFQFNGDGRMPKLADGTKVPDFKPYTVMNTQITKYFRNWSVYVGCENIGDFTQKAVIVQENGVWDESFDTSRVWGPIHGRKLYFGFRFAIDRD